MRLCSTKLLMLIGFPQKVVRKAIFIFDTDEKYDTNINNIYLRYANQRTTIGYFKSIKNNNRKMKQTNNNNVP